MTAKYFVEILRKIVHEQAVNDTIKNLVDPPGKNPSERLKKLSLFYSSLNDTQKVHLKEIINETSEMTFFGMLCVLDGVRVIESGEDKGSLELWYRKGEETYLLNDIEDDFLHDLI